MSGLSAPIKDLLAKISTLQLPDLSGNTAPLFARVWNNQYQWIDKGNSESYPFPNAFLEVVMPNEYSQLAMGWTESDIIFRIHLGMWEADAEDGTMEQNLTIFDYRDDIIGLLTYYQPVSCGALMKVNEEQDYSHTNIYHYVIDFKCGFVDDTGDITKTQITTGPPTTLEIIAAFSPIEILNVIYTGGGLQIFYRLLQAQNVIFNIDGTPNPQVLLTETESDNYNISISLSSGQHLITAQAVADNFTTPVFNLIV